VDISRNSNQSTIVASHNETPVHRESVPVKDFVPRLGAGCLVLIGIVIALLGISTVRMQGAGIEGIVFGVALGVGFLVAGLFWYGYATSQERARRELFEEKILLTRALKHAGTITLAQLALETPFTAAEAEAAMARLCRQGVAHLDLLQDGTVCYHFGGLLDD
jgi:hypothetical protein